MESVKKARNRLRMIPRLLAECSSESTAYARCVLEHKDNLQKADCTKEFEQLAKCVKSKARRSAP